MSVKDIYFTWIHIMNMEGYTYIDDNNKQHHEYYFYHKNTSPKDKRKK